MRRTVLQNNKGLTLVEVLIAMLVLLFASIAMMQTALVSIDANMINVLRDEAIRIAEEQMNKTRNTNFDALVAGTTTVPVTRDLRKITAFSYTVTRTIADLNPDNKRIDITVTWTWKGNPYTHEITSILRRQ